MEIDLHHLTTAEPGDLVAVTVASKDLCHVFHPHPSGRRLPHHRAADLFEVLELVHRSHEVDGVEIAQRAARLVDVFFAQRKREIGRCQTECRESVLVSLDDDFGVETAPYLGCGDADHRLQALLEPAIGQLSQLIEVTITVETESHDGFEGRVESQDPRDLGLTGELHQSEPFTDIEARGVHRLAPFELENDLGEARARLRAHLADPRNHPHRLLDRSRNELLDCFGRRVLVLGLNRQGRVGEIREKVNR